MFVDHGLLRKGEAEQVKHDFVEATGIKLIAVDASEDFLTALKGVSEPEKKRKIIGEKFIRTFEKAQRQVIEEAGASGKEVKFLVQGTLYPDVVESGGGDGAANIKSHHNVGGLPKDIKFQLIEPLRTLFKDEVRAIGTELGLPDEIVWRQPFPGPGLGIRIIGVKALGVVDYGIHNVVAGIVTMFSFITMTLSTGTVRFFSFQLGEKNIDKLNKLFNLSLLYFCVIIVFVFIISETMGIWFVENKLTIPSERLNAAYWVFQFSIFTFAVNLIDVPFKSLIISYERMNVYAYISIIEVMLKLLIVYILTTITFDKLIVYSALLAFSSVVITLSYILYCKCYLDGCKFRPYWNAKMFRELFSFCGWNLIGALSNVLRSQGINILLNIFFTPVVNAARAIAFQINTAVNNFVLNFYTSFRPQITKLYASDKLDEMTKLVLLSSKVSFYLILFLAIPIITMTIELIVRMRVRVVPT